MKKWIEKNLILVWIISSIIFAFIIHCLFSIAAPTEWLMAKWSAGDILTFVSTVALGLLAVWQNKKFKDESEASQARMEALTTKANELSVISKIIEHESGNLSKLKTAKQNFIDACNAEGILSDLSDIANQPNDFRKLYVKIKMDSRSKQIKLCGIELLSELAPYPNDDKMIKLIDLIKGYCDCSMELVNEVRTLSTVDATYKENIEAEKELITSISDFISTREILLNEVIYGNFTLEQIKMKYQQKAIT